MKIRLLFAVISIFLFWSNSYGAECEVALPGSDNLDSPEDPTWEGFVWVGSNDLAARVPRDGHWNGMGAKHHYGDKWWWWRAGYSARGEEIPELVISASRLDGPAPPVLIQNATNAYGPGWDMMLVGMDFPTAGCWEVIGKYHGHELKFIFKVGEDDPNT